MVALSRERPPAWLLVVTVLAPLAVISAQVFGFVTSPAAELYDHSQKIMYTHVPAAWMLMVSFLVVFVASLAYLWKHSERADLLAASAAEVGTVFTGLTLLLGSIWARFAWGVWWVWDPRLTSTAVLLFVFIGYLALRAFTEDPERRATWSAGVGIFGALVVYFVKKSVEWLPGMHQLPSTPETVSPMYVTSLRANGIAFLVLLVAFIGWRYRAARIQRLAEDLEEQAILEGGNVHA
jgi:heme exporter protein C